MATRAAWRGGELLLKSVLATKKQLCVGTLWLISRSQETREMDSIIHNRVQFIAGFPGDDSQSFFGNNFVHDSRNI